MPRKQLSKQLVWFSGKHFVTSRLGLMGYVPLMTSSISSQYPGSDIMVLNFTNGKKVDVQVKTRTYQKNVNWYVPENVDDMDAIFVFDKISADRESIISYVVPSVYVARESKRQREDYIANRPNVSDKQPRMIRKDSSIGFSENWGFSRILSKMLKRYRFESISM